MKIKKYFVIGNPIEHSLSPKVQNQWIKENNIDAVYDKIKLNANQIKNFIQNIKNQEIAGCNVTIPFKNTVIPFTDNLTLEAEQTQSVNTIVFDNGKLVGHNTDIAGFYKAIKSLNFKVEGKTVLILGAGGVVSSIIFALKQLKVLNITVSNRTRSKAENLKILFKDLNVVEWGSLPEFDIIINATSLGLNNEKINLDFSKIGKNKLFYDVIYNPSETEFLKKGRELGNKTENGKLMFLYQACEAFKLWHDKEPSINEEIFKLLDND